MARGVDDLQYDLIALTLGMPRAQHRQAVTPGLADLVCLTLACCIAYFLNGRVCMFDEHASLGLKLQTADSSRVVFIERISESKSSQTYLKFWDEEEIGKNCVSRKDAKAPRTKNSQHESGPADRNSKQFQMTKIGKIPNKLPSDSVFWIFPI